VQHKSWLLPKKHVYNLFLEMVVFNEGPTQIVSCHPVTES
jgi:hypothetical protein